nr:hypothetical protein 37 [Burkholderiaceae bacterium]
MKKKINVKNIPRILKEKKQWILHANNKTPYTIEGTNAWNQASSTNPEHWSTFEEVMDAYLFSDSVYDGIGFVFTPDDDFVGIDLDKHISENGVPDEIAREFLEKVPGYSEISPRGRGLHIITRGEIPRGFNNRDHGVEMYDRSRYFTVTGASINNHIAIPDTAPDITELYNRYDTRKGVDNIVQGGDIFANLKPIAHNWDIENIKEKILSQIDPDCGHEEWVRVGMALHHQTEGNREGLLLWDEWSKNSATKYKPGECNSRWRSFSNKKPGAVTLATLIDATNAKLDKTKQIEKEKIEPLAPTKFVRLRELNERNPIPIEWVIKGWLPMGNCTGLYADGGVGKSVLALQVAAVVANGIEFFGYQCEAGKVLGIFSEDDNEEILRRMQKIYHHYNLNPEDGEENLHLWGAAGIDNMMVSYDAQHRRLELSPFKVLEKTLQVAFDEGNPYRLVVLDNISQIYGGSEIHRGEVTNFVNALTGLAKRFNCGVLVLGHIAKAQGSEFSGSTGWNNALRSRWFMNLQEDETTQLIKSKANYAPKEEIQLKMMNAVFHKLDASHSEEQIDAIKAAIKNAIEEYTKQQQATSPSPQATTYLIRLMVDDEKLAKHQKKQAGQLLKQLIADGEVKTNQPLGWKKADRKDAVGLAIVPTTSEGEVLQ